MRFQVRRVPLDKVCLFGGQKLNFQAIDDRQRDLVLDGEYVVQLAVEARGPQNWGG